MTTCPICRKAKADQKYRPFCSKRCADIDLGRWFGGDYSIPAEPIETNGEDVEKD
ncbi:DNA gyrase inhibitor YacG [uncultured Brevundimonas sp.]|uniref:DNA gyrase inhibitor YacG n=1 Tax=uncultured Brevundimonas sp. TaxID=213418 RepID=UPI0025E67F66|nr:DNA gyrase inhibitor YacG [uncultured Brevundimonas sp.]